MLRSLLVSTLAAAYFFRNILSIVIPFAYSSTLAINQAPISGVLITKPPKTGEFSTAVMVESQVAYQLSRNLPKLIDARTPTVHKSHIRMFLSVFAVIMQRGRRVLRAFGMFL